MIGRRLLMKGLLAMSGDGLVAPMNAPGGGQPVPGVQPGAPGAPIPRLIIAGPSGQMLIYDQAPPAAGHLIGSSTSNIGTDSKGNNYLGGATTYDNTNHVAVNIQFGTVTFYSFTPQPGAVFTAQGTINGATQGGAIGIQASQYIDIINASGFIAHLSVDSSGGNTPTNLDANTGNLYRIGKLTVDRKSVV